MQVFAYACRYLVKIHVHITLTPSGVLHYLRAYKHLRRRVYYSALMLNCISIGTVTAYPVYVHSAAQVIGLLLHAVLVAATQYVHR
jgi:hypothetical protein